MFKLSLSRLITLLAVVIAPGFVSANDSTLGFLFDKSDRVIIAELLNENFVTGPVTLSEAASLANYPCKFKVHRVIKGMSKPGMDINLTIQIGVTDGDRMPALKKRQMYILFLKGAQVDRWFGMQRYSQAMADELTRLAQEAKNQQRELEK